MMCIFGGGGGSPAASGPVEKGASDQSAPMRDDNMRAGQQKARDPLGRGTPNAVSGGAKRKATGGATLLTAGMADTTGKKTLLGA